MLIDTITLGILVLALIKGISRGLLAAIFSLLSFFVAIAAALKLSAITANWLGNEQILSARWAPFAAFILVFIAVTLLFRMIGNSLEKIADWAMLGWLNKAGGIVFFSIAYLLLWSMLLFYLNKMALISEMQIEQSRTYAVIAPWGPVTMDWLAKLIPVFKDVFEEISRFFEKISNEIEKPPSVVFREG